ncbi:hypothetical protein [Actinoplanes sp. NPDC051494]|uniref:hypothetical protein n=1 Tax=Actinoplanes sp. NPDC051494 TaxID=3363907 RepID=UPI003796FBAD
MATSLMPVDPEISPQRTTRLLHIAASLMPEEITFARRAKRTRTWVIVVVVVVACLLGGWFFLAHQDSAAADNELTVATTEVTDLQRNQRDFKDVVDVKTDTDTILKQLKVVMKSDLDWASLYTILTGTADDSDLTLESVSGTLSGVGTNAAADPATSLPSTSTSAVVGTLVVTGEGPDKEAVAAYVDDLGKQTVLANPYVTTVSTTEEKTVTFSLNVDFTENALCGRFGTKCTSQGGK